MSDLVGLPDEDAQTGEVPFRIEFSGPGLEGRMSANEVAGVLKAMDAYAKTLLNVAQQTLSEGKWQGKNKPNIELRPIRVEVTAFRSGSFDIVTMIQANPTLLGLILGLGGGVGGAFAFWWKNMRKRVVNAKPLPSGGWEVTMLSGEVMHWSELQWRAWNNKRIKKYVSELVEPLRGQTATMLCPSRGQATSARIFLGSSEPLVVHAEKVGMLEPEDESSDEVERFSMWATPGSVSFDPTGSWSLAPKSGGRKLSVKIEDKAFLEKVALGQARIGKNDSFHVAVRKEPQPDGENGKPKRPKFFVERVIEHLQGAEQDELPEEGQGA